MADYFCPKCRQRTANMYGSGHECPPPTEPKIIDWKARCNEMERYWFTPEEGAIFIKENHELKKEMEAIRAALGMPATEVVDAYMDYRVKYNELIMAVATKHPNLTRHQTALMYIENAESAKDDQVETARDA